MSIACHRNALVIAVLSGMIVGPIDVGVLLVIAPAALRIRIDVARVKIVCVTDSADRAEGRAEVLMVADRQKAATGFGGTV